MAPPGAGLLARVNLRVVGLVALLYTGFFLLAFAPAPRRLHHNSRIAASITGSGGNAADDIAARATSANKAFAGNEKRRAAVVQMALHAWSGYRKYADGHDELRPVSERGRDNWGATRPTAFDSIDTLLLMGLKAEAEEAMALALPVDFRKGRRDGASDYEGDLLGETAEDPLQQQQQQPAQKDSTTSNGKKQQERSAKPVPVQYGFTMSVFETTIRHVGSMLSAFSLTGEQRFADKAVEVADALMPAFSGRLGLASHGVAAGLGHSTGNQQWCNGKHILAEVGSLQLELRYLSEVSGKPEYGAKAERFTEHVLKTLRNGWPTNRDNYESGAPTLPHKGLWPTFIDPESGKWSGAASLASLSDSFYEYQLKQWILFGKRADDPQLELYENTVEAILEHLLHYTPDTHYAYIGHVGIGFEPTLDHLTCFVPGMLALGVMHGAHRDMPGRQRTGRSFTEADVATAAVDLAATCYRLYLESPTGIGPEVVNFDANGTYTVTNPKYILRPETLESLFYLYRYTHDEKYRDWGWAIVEAIERHCRTEAGYSALRSVTEVPPKPTDSMESFFIAETLKYAYLLFSEDSALDLDAFVFNTEAHLMKIRR